MSISSSVRAAKRLVRRAFPVRVPHAQWERLLGKDFARWQDVVRAPSARRVLLAPSNGHPAVTTLDSLLAAALTLRGATVDVLLCDHALPACQNSSNYAATPEWLETEFLRHGPVRDVCASCYAPAAAMFEELGVRVLTYSDYVTAEDRARAQELSERLTVAEIENHVENGVRVGEHARAGTIRFFASSALEREPHADAVIRRFFRASLITHAAISRLLEENNYDAVSFHHGIYVPQGIIGEVGRSKGVRVVNWCQAYRKNSFIFSHGDTYHHTLMTEPVSAWEDLPWDAARESELLAYLSSRWTGAQDWISFNRAPVGDLAAIQQETGIDFSKPTVCLLTNVVWDAQLHYPQNAFGGMLEWLKDTIEYFVYRPDLQLVIRVHPAEATGQIRSRQPVEGEIRREFPKLPSNVFVIGAESKVSTYAVALQCDSVLIYGTKTGVELTSLGVPVIVAGEAWIRNKGITTDVDARERYREVLDRLPLGERLDEETVTRARKYAYHFFFRRMIPLASVQPQKSGGWSSYEIAVAGLDALLPGQDAGLDVICDGILTGAPFVHNPVELGSELEGSLAAEAHGR